MLRAVRFRVQNFLNINDSGWIPLERVTAFVGRNEAGKTALLKALHKFNPATPVAYNPQREFPRDRYKRDFKNGADWPVCSVVFEITSSLEDEIGSILEGDEPPREVICTKYYDGTLEIELKPPIERKVVSPESLIKALRAFSSSARRLESPNPEKEESTQTLRTDLATWANGWREKLGCHNDLRDETGTKLLSTIRNESEGYASPLTATMLEKLQMVIETVKSQAIRQPKADQIIEIVSAHIPVFIYFENYGILSSATYLPRFLEDLNRAPDDPQIRTINAMFKHVQLSAKDIAELGREQAQKLRAKNQEVTAEVIEQDQQRKERRAIELNSASIDITNRFNKWYGQRRHSIDYDADGDYFRIWVADDRRPGVKIELEGRSKGFQWFFSFYLVFLVESEEGYKDAILLLDEPGLHLHPTAQQELIYFFEQLSEKNQLVYTTHSPFLIDGEHIHRVRPVTEDDSGHSRVSVDGWPKDRETIFPLQAAAGYAMVKGLFQHKKNVLVEGMTDYYYLYALSLQCQQTKRSLLPEDIYIIPCGGTKLVGHVASLFLGQKVRPLILLDGDEAGRIRRNALMKELYSEHETAVLMLDDIFNKSDGEFEIEDIFGEDIILPAVSGLTGQELKLTDSDRKVGDLIGQIKAAAMRQSIELPEGWKASVATRLVSEWAEKRVILPAPVLDKASLLFEEISKRFEEITSQM